ncbi:GNAT family N-acetyltransferase [Actinokineospora auranticolor]|uniref:Acetyltransferase (GNAT) family protein n=1 Tax=Actinokineospora auranticolor TaxID=155976 RepID=A0A2S6GJL8_9PSEU|nr:GNAT family N-acetyltransferase [Actinokineospora auranticolor]PPK65390.1 acetyltransferase (GNAT) family protein [Actinokineospora auranticolor]
MHPITGPEEVPLFCRPPYVLNDEVADDLAAGRRRPERLWVALRDDRLVARVGWWGRAGEDAPFLLDIFDTEDVVVGEHLLRTAMASAAPARPHYLRTVTAEWRTDPATTRCVAALERTGAWLLAERVRFEWRPGTPVPPSSGRLVFRSVRDTGEILDLMTRALDGTLDAHSLDDLTRLPPRAAATRHFDDELARFHSPRSWWRVATLPGGEPVGFITPGRNDYNAVIGYPAVLPEHRGNGYINDLLAEATRILAAQGVPRIRAATDLDNTPMAAAFTRAGYLDVERTIVMAWSK